MISTKEFKTGLKIEIDGKPFEIVEFQHFKPGKGGAMVRTKLRQMKTGQVLDKTFRSGEKVKKPDMVLPRCSSSIRMDRTLFSWIWKRTSR